MKNSYFSIGEYCASAFQLRRWSGRNDAFFFDWLVTPGSAFDFIRQSSDQFLMPGNWDIVGEPGNEGIRVRDKFSGLLFQHEFPTIDGKIDAARVEEHLATAREKFTYLKNKTIAAIAGSPNCVLVRAENALVTLDDALERANQIRQAFMPINPNIKTVLASTNFEGEFRHPEFIMIKLQPHAGWEGDNASWDRLLTAAEQLL